MQRPKHVYSRSRFLNGDFTTFFAPGQSQLFQDNYDPTQYAPPTDWPGAGTILRRPEVVYLCINNPVANSDPTTINYPAHIMYTKEYYIVTTSPDSIVPPIFDVNNQPHESQIYGYEELWTDGYFYKVQYVPQYSTQTVPGGLGFQGYTATYVNYVASGPPRAAAYGGGDPASFGVGTDIGTGPTQFTITTPGSTSRANAIKDIFDAVKAQLAPLRRCLFVDVLQTSYTSSIPCWFPAPDTSSWTSDQADYFPTNFLMIYVDGQSSVPAASSADVNRIQDAFSRFKKYRVDLYYCTQNYSKSPEGTAPQYPVEDYTVENGGSKVNKGDIFWTSVTGRDQLLALNQELEDEFSGAQDDGDANAGAIQSHKDSVDGLGQYNINYIGTDDLIQQQVLVQTIADFFGFDPQTGHDLPKNNFSETPF